jgi:hypothetical protein
MWLFEITESYAKLSFVFFFFDVGVKLKVVLTNNGEK